MKILQVSGYPFGNPVHGGQKRCNAIKKGLVDAGHRVKSLCVSYQNSIRHYKIDSSEEIFLVCSEELNDAEMRFSILEDVLPSVYCLEGKLDLKLLMTRCQSFAPDLVIFEQPFLWPLFREFCLSQSIFAVYSSQNIEYCMKRKIYEKYFSAEIAQVLSNFVQCIESQLVKDADLIVYVTDTDQKHWGSEAAKKSFVLPNASTRPAVDEGSKRAFSELLKGKGFRKYAFFVGSDHDPNAAGFIECLGDNLSFLAPHEGIVIIGGVNNALQRSGFWDGLYGQVNGKRTLLLPSADDKMVDAGLLGASVVLLPITSGGGSNLKTAQAILSGKPIIATQHSFRGYHDFVGQSKIVHPRDFKSNLAMMLRTELAPMRGTKTNENILTWDYQSQRYAAALKLEFEVRKANKKRKEKAIIKPYGDLDLCRIQTFLQERADRTLDRSREFAANEGDSNSIEPENTYEKRFRLLRALGTVLTVLSEDRDDAFVIGIYQHLLGAHVATKQWPSTVDRARTVWGRIFVIWSIVHSREFLRRFFSLLQRKKNSVRRADLRQLTPLRLAPGQLTRFSNVNPDGFFGRGFYQQESWGVWSNGRSSTMHLEVSGKCEGKLLFKVMPALFTQGQELRTHVRANGHLVATWQFHYNGFKPAETSCQLGKRHLRGRRCVELKFSYSRTTAPKKLSVNQDSREIALGFIEMSFAMSNQTRVRREGFSWLGRVINSKATMNRKGGSDVEEIK